MYGHVNNHEISSADAERIRELSEDDLLSQTDFSEGNVSAVGIAGINLLLDWENPREVVIYHFWMDEKLRGRGIGALLLGGLLDVARENSDINHVHASIAEDGGRVENLLEGAGFDVTRTRKQPHGQVVEGRIAV